MPSRSQSSSTPNVLALLLPGYSPDLSWMARALNANRVILDDFELFSRKSKVHRAKIRTPGGSFWLTIPVVREDRGKPLLEVRIDHQRQWLRHQLQALEFNYRNSLYFDYYEPEIRADLETASNTELLLEAVGHLMQRQWCYLNLAGFPVRRSELPELPDSSFVHCKNHLRNMPFRSGESTVIWLEEGSRHYQRRHPQAVEPIFKLPAYRQHFDGFVARCSVLDLLFQYGPESWQILDLLNPENRQENITTPAE